MLLLLTHVPALLCRNNSSTELVNPCPTLAQRVRAVLHPTTGEPSPVLVFWPDSAQLSTVLHPQGLHHMQDALVTSCPPWGFSRQG